MRYWSHWKYKNLTFTALGLLITLILSRLEFFHSFLLNLGNFGYLSAFIAGVLFVSSFTVMTGAVTLLILAESLHPIVIGIIAGIGAVVGDLTIFRLVKDDLSQEIKGIYDHIDGDHHFTKLLHSKYFSWTLPVVGAIIIASPLPDEIGVSLMGISNMNIYKFIPLSFLLNAIGIFLVVSASAIIKP